MHVCTEGFDQDISGQEVKIHLSSKNPSNQRSREFSLKIFPLFVSMFQIDKPPPGQFSWWTASDLMTRKWDPPDPKTGAGTRFSLRWMKDEDTVVGFTSFLEVKISKVWFSRWWNFKYFFYVHPEPWGRFPFWLISNGLKPPTRYCFPHLPIYPYMFGTKGSIYLASWYIWQPGSLVTNIHEQWKKTWLVRVYRGWKTTHLYRDYTKPI